jgi:3-methyladenine DNA glycosylase AlkC
MNDSELPPKLLLKDQLFNQHKVAQIAGEIQGVYAAFAQDAFVRTVVERFPELELKARIAWIAACLKQHLPTDYQSAVTILLQALPAPNNPELADDDFGDFIYAPYTDFVAKYGCTQAQLAFSLAALREMTMRFSAEDAIRYFINAFPQETVQQLLLWSTDAHYHVRRLCSEGTRPKLPWAQKINIPITAPLPILDNLFADKTRFVTRSVANHLNDLAKIDPDLVIDILTKWRASGRQQPRGMEYITRHALRTLVKQGHPQALALLGFSAADQVSLTNFSVPPQVKMDSELTFSFTVEAEAETDVIIDYILYFQSKLGKLSSKKVFKLTRLTLVKAKPVVITKRHLLRQQMTTRTLYTGEHAIEIQINGKVCAKATFLLEVG